MTMVLKVLQVQSTVCESVSRCRTPVESSDQRPMMKTSSRTPRTYHWGMQAPRYLKGVSKSTSWIMSWSRQEVTLIEGGPWCFPHHRHKREKDKMFVNQDYVRYQREVEYSTEVNFSWTYRWHDSGLGSIWHQMIRGHGDKAMSRWMVKQDNPNPRRQV